MKGARRFEIVEVANGGWALINGQPDKQVPFMPDATYSNSTDLIADLGEKLKARRPNVRRVTFYDR